MDKGANLAMRWLSAPWSCLAKRLPCDCFLCGANSGHALLCPSCEASLPRLTAQRCPQCAQPMMGGERADVQYGLQHDQIPDPVCGACLRDAPHFDATTAVWSYDFPLSQIILSLKFARRLASAEFFAAALLEAAVKRLESQGGALASGCLAPLPDFILPVPLSARRLAQRGFNQAMEISRPLSKRLAVPLMRHDVVRQRDTTPQTRLPWKARAKNIRHAFECHLDLGGKTVWVVDDVMTTGATLNELARTLKLHGAARVENFVLARAVRRE